MEVSVKHYGRKPEKIQTKVSKVLNLLSELSINPETVIIRLNSEIVTPDTKLKTGDEIEMIPVVSGG